MGAAAPETHEDQLHPLVPAHGLLEEDGLVIVATQAVDVGCAWQRGVLDDVGASKMVDATASVGFYVVGVHQVGLHVFGAPAVAANALELPR